LLPEKSVMLACYSPKMSIPGALIRLTNILYHAGKLTQLAGVASVTSL
jgi:hypothetical protein